MFCMNFLLSNDNACNGPGENLALSQIFTLSVIVMYVIHVKGIRNQNKRKLSKEIFNKKKSLIIPNININSLFLYKKIVSKDLYYIIFKPVYSWNLYK